MRRMRKRLVPGPDPRADPRARSNDARLSHRVRKSRAEPGANDRGLPNRALSFLAVALPVMAGLYLLIYLGHAEDSVIVRALAVYLAWVARAAALVIGWFDPAVTVTGRQLGGRFPLEIVLDCAALDVQAIFAAAVVAFPAPWRRRLFGLVVGLAVLGTLNVARIACLYLIGVHAPTWFHTMHEEVLQIAVVLGTCLLFASWAFWAGARSGPRFNAEPDVGAA